MFSRYRYSCLLCVAMPLCIGCGPLAARITSGVPESPIPQRSTYEARCDEQVNDLRSQLDELSPEDLEWGFFTAIQRHAFHLLPVYREKLPSLDLRLEGILTPLGCASLGCNPVGVQELLAIGVDVDETSRLGEFEMTPLAISIRLRAYQSAQILLDAGADLNLGSEGATARELLRDLGLGVDVSSRKKIREFLSSKITSPPEGSQVAFQSPTREQEIVAMQRTQREADSRWREEYATVADAVREHPMDAAGWIALTDLFLKYREFESARLCAEKATSLQPDSAAAKRQLAEALRRVGKVRTALSLAQECCRDDANDWESRRLCGVCYRLLGAYDKARAEIDATERMVETQESRAQLANDRLLLNLAQQNWEKAKQLGEQAIRKFPDYKFPYYNLAKANHALGFDDEAIHNLSVAIALDPLYSSAYLRRGYYRTPGIEAAQDYFAAISTSQRPTQQAPAWTNLSRLGLQARDGWGALRYANLAIEADASAALAYKNRAEALTLLGMATSSLSDQAMARALADLERILELGDGEDLDTVVDDSRLKVVLKTLSIRSPSTREVVSPSDLDRTARNLGKQMLWGSVCAASEDRNQLFVTRALLAHGVDPNGSITDDGNTLLHYAAAGCDSCVPLHVLLEAGADAQARNNLGERAVDLLLARIASGDIDVGLADQPSESGEVPPTYLFELVQSGLRREFRGGTRQLQTLGDAFEREQRVWQREFEESEEEIRELEIAAAASAAGGYTDRRQMAIEMNAMHERFEREREQRQAMASPPSAAKAEAFAVLEKLGPIVDARSTPGSINFIADVVCIQDALSWVPR